ncbi:MAG: OmpA family protein, partial [Verrucomicrobiales bacterium]|nr:OmpA family protein [Verrucomicrobiales bacterium]
KMALGNAAKIEGVTVDNQIKISDEVTSFPAMDQTVKGVPVLVKAANNGKIEVDSEKVVLYGMVSNKSVKDSVLSQFSTEAWQGPKVIDKVTIKPKKVAPTFAWKQDGPKKVILSGKVPDVKVRDSLIAAAKKRLGKDGEIVDKMVIDSNVRNDPWLTALPVFASQSMPKVEMPDININAQKASISGKVPSSTVMNDVSLAFSGINPPGKLDVQLDVVKPQPPKPATMPARTAVPDIAVTGTGQRLTVAGKVPNQKAHDTIVNSILGMEDIDHLDKKLKIGNDVKEETYLDALPDFIGNFYNGSVKERELWLKNKELTLRGVLPSDAEKNKTLAMAEPLKKKGVKVIDLLTVEPAKKPGKAPEPPTVAMTIGDKPDEKQPPAMEPTGKDTPTVKVPDKVKDVPGPVDPEKGELHSVYFGTGEFHIRDSQKPRAEKLLERAKQTRGKIVIDGYADERGEEETNVFLSDQRAKRIRAYLISNGIDQSRIVSVVGRGEIPNGKYREYRRTDVRIIESK